MTLFGMALSFSYGFCLAWLIFENEKKKLIAKHKDELLTKSRFIYMMDPQKILRSLPGFFENPYN